MGKDNRIFGQVGKLLPEKVDEYCALHQNPWDGVLKTIRAAHIHNYFIFREGLYVFSSFVYDGDDYETDMKIMGDEPIMQEWWAHTRPCFEKYAISADSEFCHDMEQIFVLE